MEETDSQNAVHPEEPPTLKATQNSTDEASLSKSEACDGGQTATSSDRPENPAVNQVTKFRGIPEWVRTTDGKLATVQYRYSLPHDEARDLQRRFARAESKYDAWERMPLPTGYALYGTTEELFTTIKKAIAEQTNLSDKDSALLTFWVFSTWFCDVLLLAPGLVLTGSAHDGDAVLRTLYAFCYHPILLPAMTSRTLNEIKWEWKPTLLIFEPSLSKRSAGLLCSSTRPGYLVQSARAGSPSSAVDYYSSKAIYAGEDPPATAMLQHCVHVNVSPIRGASSQHMPRMSEEMTQRIQNQLLRYRFKYLPEVSKLELSTAGLTPDFNEIVSALGECIVDAPVLHDELVSLLSTYSEQQIAERLDDLGTLTFGAALALCHQGKDRIMVSDIAAEVNQTLKGHGEKLQYSPEKVGHRMKKAGLPSRRQGAAGNGYLLDHATLVRVHEVAFAYGYERLSDGDKNLHCQLCEQFTRLV